MIFKGPNLKGVVTWEIFRMNAVVGVMIPGCLKASNNGQAGWPTILKPSFSPNDRGPAKLSGLGQSLKPGLATTPSSCLCRKLRGN